MLLSYNSKATVSLQIVCQVALLLPSLVICTVISQVALFSSYNSKVTVSSLCSLPVPILFSFFLIYLNFVEFLSEKSRCVKFVLKLVHYASFLQQSVKQQIVLSIRSLCSLLTMVCDTVRNIVCQVAVLPSFTGNLHCCKSGRSAPFLQQ